ncbi:MAG: outer membrane protein assembly factor BamD [Pirellulales bacterium]|nr:outer membrane protein assembly factor BamD [Pirellulales bacterium]
MIPARTLPALYPGVKLRRLRTFGLFAGFFSILALAGCRVPPPPPHAAQQRPAGDGNDDGWLWRQLRGEAKPNAPTASARTPSQSPPASLVQPQTDYARRSPPATSAVIPAVGAVSPSSKGGTIIPTVAVEPLESAKPDEIPMSKLGPAQPVVTPPPVLPSDPPPSVVSSNSANPALEKKGFELSDLKPDNIYKSMKKAAGYGPSEPIARAAFKDGKELFAQKKYPEAAAQFKTAADRWPDTPLEEDALFLQAESYFFADEYVKAHDAFEKLFKKYNNTRHLETAVSREFAIGRFWEQLHDAKPLLVIQPNFTDKGRPWFDTFGYALKAYQNVRMYDPTGPLADQSVMAIGTAYFRRDDFENAALEFDQLRKDYPNSDHQMLAHVLGLQAKMRVYQGDMYDKTALKEAHEIADSALTQYGPKLGEEQARMIKARSRIVEEEANRLYVLGQYYEKNKYHRAARFYYQSVIDEYPRTEKSELAKQRLAAIRDKPDQPPNHVKWLTDLLPESKKR